MKLRVRNLLVSSGGPLVALVHHRDAVSFGIAPLERVQLVSGRHRQVDVVDVVSGRSALIQPGEIGLFLEVTEKFRVHSGAEILLERAEKPLSLQYIKDKLDGQELTSEHIDRIIKDLLANALTEVEASYFVAACYMRGMTLDESAALAVAIAHNAETISFSRKIVVDKHCIGGLPGNRTTPILVALLAALGYTIPKTSTRSITSPAGTADTVEVFCPVAHSVKDIKRIVQKTGGCMVWGGALGLASADDLLIKLERPLSLDPRGILLASILAKKAAVGSTHVLIDMPVGPDAKLKTVQEAEELGERFVALGTKLGMHIQIYISDGRQPVGCGIGPVLEARDLLLVLQGNGPRDLREKSLALASALVAMTGQEHALELVTDCLDSGRAYTKFCEIIKAQGGNPHLTLADLVVGQHTYSFVASKKGIVSVMDIRALAYYAKLAGAPQDKRAGIYCPVKIGHRVARGDVLFTLYAERAEKLAFARAALSSSCITIR